MSTNLFPSLPGLAYPVSRSPVWDSTVQTNISGKEVRIANYTFPRWKWELTFNILRSSPTYNEFQQLAGFFNARQGQFDTFLYSDADDNAVTGQAIGTGTGTTSAFQLVRAFGGFVEPILAPNVVSAVYLNGVSVPSAAYAAPGTALLGSQIGGSLAATTYYVRCSWVTNSGETLAGTEASSSASANTLLFVTQPSSPPAAAIEWRIYASNTAGGGSGAETLQATVAIGTTSWTEPSSGLVAGAAMPAANTTGWSVSNWGTSTPGILTFGGPIGSGVAVTADFSYYWPCRMDSDTTQFGLFMNQFYECKKYSFTSVKN